MLFRASNKHNMPFIKSGVDFMADRFYFGCNFYIN